LVNSSRSFHTDWAGDKMADTSWELLLERVRKVFWETWDPIGVNDHPAAATEYDSYAPRVVGMLIHDCSAAELDHHLSQIETTDMGLPSRPAEARASVVVELLALRRKTT
jgi:hypothetical protein